MICRLRGSSVCFQLLRLRCVMRPVVPASLKPLLGPTVAAIAVMVACPGVVAAADERRPRGRPRRQAPRFCLRIRQVRTGREGSQEQKASESRRSSRINHRPCNLPLCKLRKSRSLRLHKKLGRV